MRARFLLVAAFLLVLAALPLAGAQGSGTTCRGGETDYRTMWIDPPPMVLMGLPVHVPKVYLATQDGSIWVEENGIGGLQRTDRICYDQTWDENGTITSSRRYVDYTGDMILVP